MYSPSKPSRPGRAYLHLLRKDDILALSDVVRAAKWEDAKGSFNDPALIAPPGVEFAIYKKFPANKKRNDARQGTIDQDPQFMAFLEELANPAPPREVAEGENGGEDGDKAEVKVTTTPLIEYLKEKKANKGKEASGKNAKGGKAEAKGKGASKEEEQSSKKKGKGSKEDKAGKAAAPKENVKILTKRAATEQAAEAAKNVAGQINSAASTTASGASVASAQPAAAASQTDATPKTRRAGIAAAARILQRDLGLSPGSAHRRARQDAAKAENGPKASDDKDAPAASPTAVGTNAASDRPVSPAPSEGSQASKGQGSASQKSQSGRRNRGSKNAEKNKAPAAEASAAQPAAPPKPMMILKKPDAAAATTPVAAAATSQAKEEPAKAAQAPAAQSPAKPAQQKTKSTQAQQKKAPAVTADATQAFIKHANPSQGVNEAALRQALGPFGTITGVEVDKRKGFAFVDFADHESLVKAIQASPVSVGQTTVQVLERKDKKQAAPAAAAAAAAATPAATPSNAGSSSTPNAEKPEKPSGGRGRRGRGGGGGNKASGGGGDKAQAAASQPAANPGG